MIGFEYFSIKYVYRYVIQKDEKWLSYSSKKIEICSFCSKESCHNIYWFYMNDSETKKVRLLHCSSRVMRLQNRENRVYLRHIFEGYLRSALIADNFCKIHIFLFSMNMSSKNKLKSFADPFSAFMLLVLLPRHENQFK